MCEELLTCAELAAKLKIRPSTIRRWKSQGIIPAVRIGGVTRYRLTDVLAAGRKPDEEKPKRKLKVNRPPKSDDNPDG